MAAGVSRLGDPYSLTPGKARMSGASQFHANSIAGANPGWPVLRFQASEGG